MLGTMLTSYTLVFLGYRRDRGGGIHGKSNKETFGAIRKLSWFGSM